MLPSVASVAGASGWCVVRRQGFEPSKFVKGVFSARRSVLDVSRDPLSSGLPQSSPSFSGTPHGFPYCGSLLRRWVGSTAGAAISLTSFCFFSRRRGYTLSLSLYRPSPNKNPAFLWQWQVLSGLPESRPQLERQSSSSALTRLLVMISSLPHRSHAHSTTLPALVTVSRPSAYLSPIGRSGTSNPCGLRWSPHLLPMLFT